MMDFDAFCEIASDAVNSIGFLRHYGILPEEMLCEQCSQKMVEHQRNDISDKINFVCNRCNTRKSIRSGSFLKDCKVPIKKFLWVVRMWAHNQIGIASFLSISPTTSANMTKSFRKICSWKLSTLNLTLGGPGIIIQIDESVISRAMHNRGHDLLRPKRWVLGMYEATSKIGIVICIPNRKADTLKELIMRHVLGGSIIHTDGFASYKGLETLPVNPPYVHETVNHSLFFRDPLTGAHTNNVEAYWASVKKSFKRGGQTRRILLQPKIDEKMWRERFGKTPEEAFENILSHIAEYEALE
ncbi:hypothetical protein RF11_02073 [Thelohanellus kitauei]|uniref:ISXO2-like transposase domain-containing protein n=1 Tax=Thelohanellus kitauei TaxID=669202 RepID=A0A0C2ILW1_THEKT|nr:hypothetical protein RF11_02073 [Thelohanellus kitauei]